ncbi:MAG: Ig-like domain-containing protein, partial [Cytophagales bacterium]|nr:Ig-like domain-containing protein [Cytophagales bacterium]
MRKKSSTSTQPSPLRRAGTRLYRYVLLLLGLCAAGYPAQAQTEKRIYTVGNSVTDGVNFAGFKALAESRGYVHTLARHMIPGAPLSWLWDNQNSGFTESPYGAPNNAFPNYTWDAITLQPFDRMIEGSDGDRQMARNYINLARGKSPDVQFYIYSRYPRKKDGLAETAANWNSLWLAQYTGGYDGTNETRDFFEDLTTAVRTDYAGTGLKQPLMIPLGQAMHALNNKMAAGQVPGFSSIWQVYADGIHMTNVGSYIVACSFFATIYKESPVGLPVPSQYGAISNTIRDIIQQTVWETVTGNSSWTGVSSGTVNVTGVSVSPTNLSLTLNQTGQLTPTISPANASNKNVSWSSSNTAVATVSATGVVTGVSAGSATITVTTQDGGRTATASVTVSSTGVAVTGVSVSPTSATVNTGNTTTLTATVAPANASNKNVSWSSSNTAIATVSAAGVVTGVSAGSATITVTTQDGSRTATSAITVTANSKPVAVISATPTSGAAPLAVQFSAANSTDPNPGDFILGFDWDFGDGSPRANSNAPSHTYAAAGTYTVTLRVMDNHDLYSDLVSTTITVSAGGSIVREYWTGITGTSVADIPVGTNPTGTDNIATLEGPTNWADNYGTRIRAFITPATTGSYTFYIAGDDNSQLFLGTNDNPATKVKIAEVTGWTNSREWTKQSTQTSTARSLTAGTRYYVEVLHKEGGGGDNVAVGWTGPGISAITVIGGSVLSPYTTTPSGFSGTYKLTARHSSKALDVANSATQDGANVQQWTDNGT